MLSVECLLHIDIPAVPAENQFHLIIIIASSVKPISRECASTHVSSYTGIHY
jgi:hypothetical protein